MVNDAVRVDEIERLGVERQLGDGTFDEGSVGALQGEAHASELERLWAAIEACVTCTGTREAHAVGRDPAACIEDVTVRPLLETHQLGDMRLEVVSRGVDLVEE